MESVYETPEGLARASFQAMGTTIVVIVPEQALDEALRLTRGLFAEWEDALSRFRPESELSLLNAAAGFRVPVSGLLMTTLSTALNAARATRGVFDPTILQRMLEIGYDRSFETLAASLPAPRAGCHAQTGRWREIEVDEARRLVRLPAGVGLDFGGIAKGMAVDAALDLLEAHGLTPALVNGGGDLAVREPPPNLPHWPVLAMGKDEAWVIGLERGALATSGVARRRWLQGQTPRHHLIDPRTGEPADSSLWSVSALGGRCAQAEVAAKTALILGREAGTAFIEETRLGALLVAETGDWSAAGAWPLAGMRRIEQTDPTGQGVIS